MKKILVALLVLGVSSNVFADINDDFDFSYEEIDANYIPSSNQLPGGAGPSEFDRWKHNTGQQAQAKAHAKAKEVQEKVGKKVEEKVDAGIDKAIDKLAEKLEQAMAALWYKITGGKQKSDAAPAA